MDEIGRTLKRLRREAGLSQRALAASAFSVWQLIGAIERGERKVSLRMAENLDEALNTGGLFLALVKKGKGMTAATRDKVLWVSPDRYQTENHRITYTEESERTGEDLETRHTSTRITADEYIAERLGIEPGAEVFERRYTVKLGGQVTTRSRAWEPISLTGGTEIEDPHAGPYSDRGIVPRFTVIGLKPTSVEHQHIGRHPTTEECAVFDVDAATILAEVRQSFLCGQTVVQAADIVYLADRYDFHYGAELRDH
ncbi:UTRA domain-containing protein [Longispora sp. NPDC051575]|uniref:UTRA domain-containing protein n=1 Tax=Longispora sp. NPDC051575 TaxID=3154943 RepID=UPI00342BF4AF